MCNSETIIKLSKYLKVNLGKIEYDNDKGLCRKTKNDNFLGYTTIIGSLLKDSTVECAKDIKNSLELNCLVAQWLDYSILYIDPASKDKQILNTLLKELNLYLSKCSYLIGQSLTFADIAVFYAIHPIMLSLSSIDKEMYINLSRWYDHLQQNKTIQQDLIPINFITIHLGI